MKQIRKVALALWLAISVDATRLGKPARKARFSACGDHARKARRHKFIPLTRE